MTYPNTFFNRKICLLFSSSKMEGEEILDSFKASGSEDVNFSAEIFLHEEIKPEKFDGWDAAA